MSEKWSINCLKMVQKGSKNGPEMVQKWPRMIQKWFKNSSKWSNMGKKFQKWPKNGKNDQK